MTREEVVEALVRQMMSEAPAPPHQMFEEIAEGLVRPLCRDIVASGVPYLLVEGKRAIFCMKCGSVSHNPHDVEQRYCGCCHEFLEPVQ